MYVFWLGGFEILYSYWATLRHAEHVYRYAIKTLAISSRMPHLIDNNATGIVTSSSHIAEHVFDFLSMFARIFGH